MLTTLELRVLYQLRKRDNRAKLAQISEALHRFAKADRDQSLTNLESLGLISSGKTLPPKVTGGRGGLVYWLTSEGVDCVQGMIDAGELPDPKRPAATPAERSNHGND